jgi:hypothetical protein
LGPHQDRGGREATPCDIVRLLHRGAAGYKLIRKADPQRIRSTL